MRATIGWALALLMLLVAGAAQADETFCSDAKTRKPGLRAELWLVLPAEGAAALENAVSSFAASELSMSVSSVGMEDPDVKPMLKTSDLILQSRDVSVAVSIQSSNRSDRAYVTLERTCVADALVPWEPYWAALTAYFRRQGYRIVPPPANWRKAGFMGRGRLVQGP